MKYMILPLSLCAMMAYGQNVAPAAKLIEIPPDTVVAKVGGTSLTAAELNKLVSTFPQEIQQAAAKDPKQVIQSYFLMQSLAQQALKDKLDEDVRVKEEIELQRMQVLANAAINHHAEAIAVSDEDVRKRYEKDKGTKYQQAKIRAIMIRYDDAKALQTAVDMSDPKSPKTIARKPSVPEYEAQKMVDELVKQARAGADFATLAKEKSQDPQTAANGGLFPILRQSDRGAELIKRVVFSMKPGDISDPVKLPVAFYVIKLEELGIVPFEEVRAVVTNEIKQERFTQWMEDARKPFEVTVENPMFFGQPSPAGAPAPTAAGK